MTQDRSDLRVLQIVGDLPSRERPWVQPFVASQIESLRRLGIHLDVLELGICCGAGWRKYAGGVPRVRHLVKKNHYDCIHAHYSYCGWVARAQWSTPVIVSLMGDDLLGEANWQGAQTTRGHLDCLMSRLLTRCVDHVVVKSVAMMRRVSAKDRVSVIPNGVDFDLFRPSDRVTGCQRMGLDGGDRIILFTGNPALPRKNFPLAERAVDLLNKEWTEKARLFVFWGRSQDQMPAAMNAADALLVTSFWEGSPNVVKEAMACNLPVVAVDVGDIRQIIGDAENCFVCEHDCRELAAALFRVLESGQRSNGRELIEHLRLESVASRIEALYRSVSRGTTVISRDSGTRSNGTP